MSADAAGPRVATLLDRTGHVLEVDERFSGPDLDMTRWLPCYLPQWSSRSRALARYRLEDGGLQLRIDEDQGAWCPEWDGETRVSSLQTGSFSGPVGSPVGQHRFRSTLVVREAQPSLRLYTPRYGYFEMRARATNDPDSMVALWMIGLEDEPEHSGEICVFEIFGRDVRPDGALVGMGVHPFSDPRLSDDFAQVPLAMDAREAHVYGVEWAPGWVAAYVDEVCIRVARSSPAYPMQFMLGIYEFRDRAGPRGQYPKVFQVDWFRGWHLSAAG